MRRLILCITLLLSAAPCSAQIGTTNCYQDLFGNWQCQGQRGDFQLQKSSFEPDTWRITPRPGSGAPSCTIRRDLLGNIQSTCN